MDKKWHYTEKGEYPQIFGEYEKQNYPQIPCLVQEQNCSYGVRYWNPQCDCWDDEECDDYYCEKDGVRRWMYLDPIMEEE